MADLKDYSTNGDIIHAPDGTRLFAPGDLSSAFLIVTKGAVRVEHTNSAGRTRVLYRVEAGDSCVLTTTCLLSDRPYSGWGYADGDVTAIAIPATRFRALLANDPAFQTLVFQRLAHRVGELTDVIDDLLEHRTDLRLARWIANRDAPVINMKHQDIAQELGTAREVVSRSLKAFEAWGWIKLGRGTVTVLNNSALSAHGRPSAM